MIVIALDEQAILFLIKKSCKTFPSDDFVPKSSFPINVDLRYACKLSITNLLL